MANELGSQVVEFSSDEKKKIDKVWRYMRLFRPGLYKVFRPWIDSLELRDEGSHYSHRVYRGWYAEQARSLRMSETSVRSKLETSRKWFAARLRALEGE